MVQDEHYKIKSARPRTPRRDKTKCSPSGKHNECIKICFLDEHHENKVYTHHVSTKKERSARPQNKNPIKQSARLADKYHELQKHDNGKCKCVY